jgi:Tol biopolymer transport system component
MNLVQVNRNGNYDIWVMNSDGSGLQQLTFGSCDERFPHWSKDGSKIAYTNWMDGIHIMNADGTGNFLVPNTDGQVGATGPDIVLDWGPCDNTLVSLQFNS